MFSLKKIHLTERKAELLLGTVISIRATSFMFSKLCLTTMHPFSLIALRFSIAGLVLFMLFHKRIIPNLNRHTVSGGMLTGLLFFLVLTCELNGMKTAHASTASFLENLAIVIVPLLECIAARKLPQARIFLSAVLAVIGVAFLTMHGGSFGFGRGECFLLGAAVFYALAIIATGRISGRGDTFTIGTVQVLTTGILAWLALLTTDTLTLPASSAQWGMLAVLTLICTGFGFTLQPVAQRHLSSEHASSFCALSPLVASVLSFIFLGDPFTITTVLGGILILVSLTIGAQKQSAAKNT